MPYTARQLRRLLAPDLIPAAQMPNTAARVAETVVKAAAYRLEDRTVRALAAAYRAAYRDIRLEAFEQRDRLGLTRPWRDALERFTGIRLQALADTVSAAALRAATTALTGGYYGRLWSLDMATLPQVAVAAPRINAVRRVLSEDIYDLLIRDLLGREWRRRYDLELEDLTLRIRRALGDALIEGEGMDAAMRRVAREMGVVTDRRRGPLGSAQRAGYRANFNRIQTLTRTVIQTQANNGAISAYEANSDILEGYEWLTARDERVCPQCRGLNGTIYSFGSLDRPPAHPNCRCTVIAVIRATMLGPVAAPPRQTFGEWARGYGMERELADFLTGTA